MYFFKNRNALGWAIAAIVLSLAVFFRLYGILEHGFHDGDEYAKHLFFTTDWQRRVLNDGVSGSLWARPSAHLLNIFLGEWFGFSAQTYAIKTAFFSISLLVLALLIARKLFGLLAAIVTTAFLGGSMTMLYWSHTSKEIIPASFFFLVALYFLLRIVDRYEVRQDIKLKHAVSFGFFISLAFTFHPNLALTVIATGVVFGIILVRFAFFSRKPACLVGLATLCASTILIIGYEIFFLSIIKSSIWAGEKDIGYLKYIFYHSDLRATIVPSFGFYAGLLSVEKAFAATLIFLSIVLGVFLKTEKRPVILSLSFIIIFVVLGYANSNAWPAFRNIAHLLVPTYLLVGAVVAIWIARIQLNDVMKFAVVITVIGAALYPATKQLKHNNRLWSTVEYIHWQAGGGTNSALFKAKQSIYHWYGYYFPYSLADNMNDLWEKFLCQDVEYLVVPEISATPELDELVTSFGEKVMNADDRFEPWASGYVELHKVFTRYEDMHNFKLLINQNEQLTAEKKPLFVHKGSFKHYKAEFSITQPAKWMTVSGNLKSFGGLSADGVAVIGVGSRNDPFKYGYRLIEADVLSKNQRAQMVANNKAGFFKIGFVLPISPENDSIIVRVFLRGTESGLPIGKPAAVNLRKYNALVNLPASCAEALPPSLGTKQRLSHFIRGASKQKTGHTRKLKAEANAIPAEWLEPGAEYRLKLRYSLGKQTVGRIEVVNKDKLIAKKLYFKPSDDDEFFDFQVPHDLGEKLFVYLSATRGSDIQYSDISIKKK